MTIVTSTFTGLVSGRKYSNGSLTADGTNPTVPVYLSDDQSTNGVINVGDNITYYLNFGGVVEAHPGIYQGYYTSAGTEFPMFYSTEYNLYYIAGQSTPGTYAITSAADDQVICFADGTAICTLRGDTAVENLAIDDVVVTASGGHRSIRWLGHRRVDCRNHPQPHEVYPIRIAAHAFGANRPARELFLSPGHPVLVGHDEDGEGGHLVPIMCLINGTTIERVAVEEVTYWHVELDEHDILLAEGLPAESYIDLGSRGWFNGADGALHSPDMALPSISGRCRPVAIDGPTVEAERKRLDVLFAMRLADACAWADETVSMFA